MAKNDRSLFTVTVRMGNQLLASYENIPADSLDELHKDVRGGVLEHKLIECAPEDGSMTLFVVGAGMEVKVWPQEDFTKWLADNERKQREAMAEMARQNAPIMFPGGFPQPPGGQRR